MQTVFILPAVKLLAYGFNHQVLKLLGPKLEMVAYLSLSPAGLESTNIRRWWVGDSDKYQHAIAHQMG
jgi:hypothetical protein